MNKEVKTITLLLLPILAMVVFATILTSAKRTLTLEPPYRIVQHELIVGASKLTDEQKSRAIYHQVPLDKVVLYRVEVLSRAPSWAERFVNGVQPTKADVNGSSCIEVGSGMYVPPLNSISINNSGVISIIEDYYDLRNLQSAKGLIEFSCPLLWEENGKSHKLKLRKRVFARELEVVREQLPRGRQK